MAVKVVLTISDHASGVLKKMREETIKTTRMIQQMGQKSSSSTQKMREDTVKTSKAAEALGNSTAKATAKMSPKLSGAANQFKWVGSSAVQTSAKVSTATTTMGSRIGSLRAKFASLGRGIRSSEAQAAGFSGGGMRGMVKSIAGIYAVQKGFQLVKGSIESANKSLEEQTKLKEVMGSMQGATKKDVQGVEDVMAQEAETGVVGKGAQRSGAQQISTYLHKTAAVKKLIPAMNDLAVQMHGTNTTNEDMVNIANMTGKVFTGQVGALRRAGISFDKHQEKVLKNGNEMQKAAMLQKVFAQNVGDMNQKMAKTPSGQYKQMRNNLAGVKTEIGLALLPALVKIAPTIKAAMPIIKILGKIFGTVLAGMARGIGDVINWTNKLFGFMTKGAKKGQDGFAKIAPIIRTIGRAAAIAIPIILALKTALMIGGVIKNVIGILSNANPVILILTAIAIAAIVIYKNWDKIKAVLKATWEGLKGVFLSVKRHIVGAGNAIMSKFHAVASGVKRAFGVIGGAARTLWRGFKSVFSGIAGLVKKAFSGVVGFVKGGINGVISVINFLIRQVNKIGISFPKKVFGISLPKAIAGKGWHIDIPRIPKLAKGTNNAKGGTTLVGEEGPELVNLPKGSQVKSNRETRKLLGGNVSIAKLADTIVVREDADIERIADRLADKLRDLSEDYVGA